MPKNPMVDWPTFRRWLRTQSNLEGKILGLEPDADPILVEQTGDTVVQNIANSTTFVTELTTNETFITELTENNTYVTQQTTNVTNIINGKKGQANELASLDANGHVVGSQMGVGSFELTIDGGGAAITVGPKFDFEVPFNCTLTGWTLLADQTGSIVIDIWKDTFANFPPTVADTIISGAKPTLSSTNKAQDLAISDWTGEALAASDILRFNVDSATTIQRVTLSMRYVRT